MPSVARASLVQNADGSQTASIASADHGLDEECAPDARGDADDDPEQHGGQEAPSRTLSTM